MKKVRFLKDGDSFEITNDFGDKEIIHTENYWRFYYSIEGVL